MKRSLLASFVGMVAIAATLVLFETKPISAKASTSTAVFDSQGRLKLPTGYRRWVYLGVSLTPNGLNKGEAPFPEFHHVYVEESNLDAYLKTGSFPEGTVLAKELSRVLDPTFPDGSQTEPSGRGYFNGAYNGLDVMVKDSKRFAKTNGWGFFTFGHHPLPYAESAEESPVYECAGCHIAYVANTDMTYMFSSIRYSTANENQVRVGVSAEGKRSDPIKLFESDPQPDLRRNKNVERSLHRQRRGLSLDRHRRRQDGANSKRTER